MLVDMLTWTHHFSHHKCKELLHLDEPLCMNEQHQAEQMPVVLSLPKQELNQLGNILVEEDSSHLNRDSKCDQICHQSDISFVFCTAVSVSTVVFHMVFQFK
jgi:hypothetical protein